MFIDEISSFSLLSPTKGHTLSLVHQDIIILIHTMN